MSNGFGSHAASGVLDLLLSWWLADFGGNSGLTDDLRQDLVDILVTRTYVSANEEDRILLATLGRTIWGSKQKSRVACEW